MNISKEEYQRYLNKDLSAQKLQQIEAYLKANPLEKKALQAIAEFDIDGSFDTLTARLEKSIDQSIKPKILPRRNKQLWPKWVGLLVLVAALISLYNHFSNNSSSEGMEYAMYFEPYPDIVSSTLRGQDDTLDTDLKDAMALYLKQDYINAADALTEIISRDSVDQRLAFYQSVSLVGAQKYKDAYPILHKLSENPAFPYMDGVIWNKALTCLALDKKEEGRQLLLKVVSDNIYKKDEALELLQQHKE